MQLSNVKKTADMRGAYGETLVELGKENSDFGVCWSRHHRFVEN